MDKDNRIDKVKNIVDKYEPNPYLAQNVINNITAAKEDTQTVNIKTTYGTGSQAVKTKKSIWLIVVICVLTCVIAVGGILFYYFFDKTNQRIYYDNSLLEFEKIDNINEYVYENEINIKYYANNSIRGQVARVKEKNEIAYITQECLFVGYNGYDSLNLNIVTMQNADFEFYEMYQNLDEDILISNISVSVSYTQNDKGNNIIYCKFSYETIDYYLSIKTFDEVNGKLEYYLNLLLN